MHVFTSCLTQVIQLPLTIPIHCILYNHRHSCVILFNVFHCSNIHSSLHIHTSSVFLFPFQLLFFFFFFHGNNHEVLLFPPISSRWLTPTAGRAAKAFVLCACIRSWHEEGAPHLPRLHVCICLSLTKCVPHHHSLLQNTQNIRQTR